MDTAISAINLNFGLPAKMNKRDVAWELLARETSQLIVGDGNWCLSDTAKAPKLCQP